MTESQPDFERWMNEVDQFIRLVTGSCMSEDLNDYPYRDAFENGESSKEVASEVLSQNGFDVTGL